VQKCHDYAARGFEKGDAFFLAVFTSGIGVSRVYSEEEALRMLAERSAAAKALIAARAERDRADVELTADGLW
jgi:hypothetical protein